MQEFKRFHPIVNLIYFLAVICFSMVFMHPILIAVSLLSGLLYSIMLKGRRAVMFSLIYMLPLFVLTAILNPLFNHEGITILTYLPDGNPLTLESLLYGIASAGMLASVIFWFSSLGEILTGEKIIYLLGKPFPSLSLVLSMALRFIPRFVRDIKRTFAVQKGFGRDEEKNVFQKLKAAVRTLSVVIGSSLEDATETALSMKSRGFGSGKRGHFSNYKFIQRDGVFLVLTLVLSGIIIAGGVLGGATFRFFPKIFFSEGGMLGKITFAAYIMLFFLPVILEGWEVLRWKRLKSKI